MTGPEHYREAERLAKQAEALFGNYVDAHDEDGNTPGVDLIRRQTEHCREMGALHATLALAAARPAPDAPASSSRYGAEFDRLAACWRVLEDGHDQIHPDRAECGGVGGCPMMFAAHNLETQMVDQMEDWRRSLAIREGRVPCACDHHGDHAGCGAGCECGR